MAERLAPLEKLTGLEGTHLLINEVYASIQGESSHAGRPCVFVRTSVCNQRCSYCDTAYAFTEGEPLALDDVVEKALGFGIPLVEITGGEPLLQPLFPELCKRLLAAGSEVLVETGGSHDIAIVPEGVKTILDIKTPGSGEEPANHYPNLALLRPGDEVKFVLTSREDYEWARGLVQREKLTERTTVLFSPAFRRIEPADLSAWLIADRLQVRLNLQLHKFIWPPSRRGV
ncbi:MAG: radical SAM protein [Planctomycetes bacterium]|nr:radical SAM protein [Planctomycetota bacterium]